MRRTIFFLAALLLPWMLSAIAMDEVIERADAVRNPSESFVMKVEIVDSKNTSDSHIFQVAIKGNTRTLVETKAPARDRGRNFLMLEENMWAYIPNLKRPVRVSLNQKLTGEAANGDISRMRWAGDYSPTLEEETDDHWQILLKANKKGLTYDQLRVWIRKENFHPYKAEFLSLAGKVLKNVEYTNYQTIAGAVRPTEIRIEDAVRKDQYSTIYIREMAVKQFPASIFNQRQLGALAL